MVMGEGSKRESAVVVVFERRQRCQWQCQARPECGAMEKRVGRDRGAVRHDIHVADVKLNWSPDRYRLKASHQSRVVEVWSINLPKSKLTGE